MQTLKEYLALNYFKRLNLWSYCSRDIISVSFNSSLVSSEGWEVTVNGERCWNDDIVVEHGTVALQTAQRVYQPCGERFFNCSGLLFLHYIRHYEGRLCSQDRTVVHDVLSMYRSPLEPPDIIISSHLCLHQANRKSARSVNGSLGPVGF